MKAGRPVEVYGSSAWHLIFTAMGHQVSETMSDEGYEVFLMGLEEYKEDLEVMEESEA